ncbi:MAG: DUF2520 domain-containing protein [Candidatus Kapaibacterium sp.]|nr:DUF2520 domain-containing protein [Ignavibacteria bacterium]
MNRKNILVVGSGRLGRTILHSFPEWVVGCLTREPHKIVPAFSDRGIRLYGHLAEVDPASFDILWLALPDSLIEEISRVSAEVIVDWKNKLVIHSSGATSLSALCSFEERGAFTAVLHPNLILRGDDPFPDRTIWGATFSSPELRSSVNSLLKGYSKQLIDIADGSRSLYHLAATFTANYPMTLFHFAKQIYHAVGISEEISTELAREYMLESVETVAARGLSSGLTGPVARGDELTIDEHASVLAREFPEMLPLFRELVKATKRLHQN